MQYILDEYSVWLPRIIKVAIILLVFMILSKTIKKLIASATKRLTIDTYLVSLLSRMSNIALIIVGTVTILGTLGIDVAALVAGLGLTGFALGFALKDTISNLLSGLLILLYRPFEIGSRISVSGYEGTVIGIDLRYTELDSEGNKVLIPNSKLFIDPITVLR